MRHDGVVSAAIEMCCEVELRFLFIAFILRNSFLAKKNLIQSCFQYHQLSPYALRDIDIHRVMRCLSFGDDRQSVGLEQKLAGHVTDYVTD